MSTEIYQNAPLVEMIAEVKWRLEPIKTVPNGALDPFYDFIRSALTSSLSEAGFPDAREKVPSSVPRELLGGQVTTQFCPHGGGWPLYQLGPGVFTANITDKYRGWDSFRGAIEVGLAQLLAAHPAHDLFQINALRILAIDAYAAQHGYKNYQDFAGRYLSLGSLLRKEFLEEYADNTQHVTVRSETTFPVRELNSSSARITIQEGKHNGVKALIVQTAIETGQKMKPEIASLMQWFDAAHDIHRKMFRSLLTDTLKSVLDPVAVS